jgi:hypothetical protein
MACCSLRCARLSNIHGAMFSPVTGSLGGAERAAAIAAANSQGLPAPLRPTKELYQEKSLNLTGVTHNQALQCTCDSVVLSWWSRFSPVVLMQHVPATHVRGNQAAAASAHAGCCSMVVSVIAAHINVCECVNESFVPTLVLCCAHAVLQMRGLGCTWQGGVLLWCTQGQVRTKTPLFTLTTLSHCCTPCLH